MYSRYKRFLHLVFLEKKGFSLVNKVYAYFFAAFVSIY